MRTWIRFIRCVHCRRPQAEFRLTPDTAWATQVRTWTFARKWTTEAKKLVVARVQSNGGSTTRRRLLTVASERAAGPAPGSVEITEGCAAFTSAHAGIEQADDVGDIVAVHHFHARMHVALGQADERGRHALITVGKCIRIGTGRGRARLPLEGDVFAFGRRHNVVA